MRHGDSYHAIRFHQIQVFDKTSGVKVSITNSNVRRQLSCPVILIVAEQRLAVSSGVYRSVQSTCRWLEHGFADESQAGDRRPTHGDLAAATRRWIDRAF